VDDLVDNGQVLELAAPHAVASGGVKIGAIFGVVRVGAAQGRMVELVTAGVHELPTVAAPAWAVGEAVCWDDRLKLCTTAAGHTRIGVAAAAAGKRSSTGRVRLDGMF
jgi:predicted RecA/RadA family phage recombinase